ncbi:MAG: GatB/YqeY domain-containing protein [Candidatus Saccharimonadales bacterium]|jgi:uncharacterized protein YqeY
MADLKQRLQDDVKAAMLAGDALRLETLRGLKSVILYAEVAAGKREEGLGDVEIESLLAKEAKKRQESADLYKQGGANDRADKELSEKAIIEEYLPKQLSEDEVAAVVDEVINEVKPEGMQQMGQVIGQVKSRLGNSADGALIAKLVKEKLS